MKQALTFQAVTQLAEVLQTALLPLQKATPAKKARAARRSARAAQKGCANGRARGKRRRANHVKRPRAGAPAAPKAKGARRGVHQKRRTRC